MSNLAHANDLTVDYWNGLAYDFSNASAYQIKQPVTQDFEVGVILKSSQLYWDCIDCYYIIPQNYAVTLSKSYDFADLQVNVSTNYWSKKSIIFPNKYNFEVGLQYNFSEHNFIKVEHYSNSNSIHNLYNISFEYKF